MAGSRILGPATLFFSLQVMHWIAFLFLVLLFNVAHADHHKIFGYSVMPESRITISGTTNISQFACLSLNESPAGSFLLEETGPMGRSLRFYDAYLQIRVSSFDCGHRVMNRNMHQSLGGEKFPYITIKIHEATNIQYNPRTSSGTARVAVAITLNGKTQKSTMLISFQAQEMGNIVVDASKKMRMSDFGVNPPSPALGLVKVNDEVTIKINLHVETGLLGVR